MKRYVVAALAVVAGVILTGCSTVRTAPDQVALHYSGGSFSSQKFQDCVPSGTYRNDGPGDKHYSYPTGQRTFTFGGPDAESDPIKVVSKDSLEMTVTGIINFNLATDCDKLKTFHEQVGIKYSAWTGGSDRTDGAATNDDGWLKMLNAYLKQPLDRAMDAAALGFTARELWSSPDAKTAYENKVRELFPVFSAEQAGGAQFFENPTITVQKPELPENIAKAIAARQEAVEQNEAQKERNVTALTELEAIKKTKEVLGPEWAVIYQLGKDGKIQVLPVPEGASVQVAPR